MNCKPLFYYVDNTIPKSTVVAYTLARAPSSAVPAKTAWVGERLCFPCVLALSCPAWVSTNPRKRGLTALLVDADGPLSRRSQKARQVMIGNIVVLRLPDLTDDPEWEQLPIMAPVSMAGMDWPVNMAASRNQVLSCAIALRRMTIYALPKPLAKIPVSGDSTPRNISPFSVVLVTSLQSRRSIADIAHVLAVHAVPLDTVVDTLKGTWLAFEMNLRAGVVGAFSVGDVLGASVELYRTRARLIPDDDEKDLLLSLWRNAHDMCSVTACLAAFEDCKEPEGYDLGRLILSRDRNDSTKLCSYPEAIWQLVSLSGWAVSFLERLMKECLSAADVTDLTPTANEFQPKLEPVDDTDVLALDGMFLCIIHSSWSGSPTLENKWPPLSSPFDSPILLHLTHPFILPSLIGVITHVNRFYHSLSALTPKGENSQIARDILMDIIGCSGLDLRGIEEVLKGAMPDTRHISGDEARLSLSKCHPVPAQYPFLQKVVHTLCTSTAIDKPRLFIKAADLIDGFASLSISEWSGKEQDRDVVTKGVLIRHKPGLLCLRCGYRSEIGGEVSVAGHVSLRWRTWEKMWASRCVCGGAWINGNL
ncbi:hypothetical protein J3R83DRAFT_2237 [Lanmaoa asiatica]|nr:hypothetical protein J3R83DRAFT_2237 [Lanmaoa asiatica]